MVLAATTGSDLDPSLAKYQFFAHNCFLLDNTEVNLLESLLNP